MSWFFYTTTTREGALVRRNGRFENVELLDRELARSGEALLNYYALPDALYQAQQGLLGRIKALEVAEFCNTLALYVGGGVDMQSALQDMAGEAGTLAYRRLLLQVRQALLNGYPLSQALRQSGQIPEEVLALAKIGEESGNLDRVLIDAAAHIERLEAIKSAVKRALIYPAFVLTIIVAAALFWLSFVVPKLAEVFEGINIELPAHFATMMAASDWVQTYWWLLGLILLGLPVAFLAGRRNEWFRLHTDHLGWRLPIMGQIVRFSQMAFWFQYLGLMYGSGVTITQSMDVINCSIKNRFFRSKLAAFNARLQEGLTLQAVMREARIFEPLALRMTAIGEDTGNLEAQMKKMAGIYFARVTALVDVLAKALEPLLVILMAGFLAFFLLGILAPIYESVGAIGRGGN